MKYSIDRPPLSEKFSLPTREELLKLVPGNLVKLIFRSNTGEVERMWVSITTQQDSSEWSGLLDNDPFSESLKEISSDEVIKFHPLDVIQIWEE